MEVGDAEVDQGRPYHGRLARTVCGCGLAGVAGEAQTLLTVPAEYATRLEHSRASPPPTRAGRKEPVGHRGRAALQDPDRGGVGQRRAHRRLLLLVRLPHQTVLRYPQVQVYAAGRA